MLEPFFIFLKQQRQLYWPLWFFAIFLIVLQIGQMAQWIDFSLIRAEIVANDSYWRIFSAHWIHTNWTHLAMNTAAWILI